uniref:Uncharacterized protein n=1 Tax=Timema monikensis TaxID=170555 RepID=A0A7R9E2H9_9NEOP|nr:unnamed protein product [Timema monikensis]
MPEPALREQQCFLYLAVPPSSPNPSYVRVRTTLKHHVAGTVKCIIPYKDVYSVMDRQTGRARPLEHGDPRTPMAWQHRNINYHHQIGGYSDRPGMAVSPDEHLSYHSTRLEHSMGRRGMTKSLQYGAQGGRPSSSSTESSTTSSTTADHDTESQLHNNRHASRGATVVQEFGPEAAVADFGTLQTLSVRSAQSTWDGEPCPVHHVALPMQMPMSMPMPMPMSMSMPMPMQMPMPMTMPPPPMALCQRLPLPPAVLLPPMLRPRPLVMPADSPALPEPLPVRDPNTSLASLPTKAPSFNKNYPHSFQVVTFMGMIDIPNTGDGILIMECAWHWHSQDSFAEGGIVSLTN